MKYCSICRTPMEDDAMFCPACQTQVDQEETPSQAYQGGAGSSPNPGEEQGNGNIVKGAVGAFLFSIGGAVLYFVLYQMGFLAGISGFVMFWLAGFGYRLLGKTKNKNCIPAMIFSILAMVVMILVAEYACLTYEVYQAYESYGITIGQAMEGAMELLEDSEFRAYVIEDLVYSYLFGFLAVIGDVVRIVKAKKNAPTVETF